MQDEVLNQGLQESSQSGQTLAFLLVYTKGTWSVVEKAIACIQSRV